MGYYKWAISKFSFIFLLFLFLTIIVKAQNIVDDSMVIRGTVINIKKEPLTSAAVIVKRNGLIICGTVTDFDGNYCLKIKDTGNVDITFAYEGYVSKAITKISIDNKEVVFVDALLDLSNRTIIYDGCIFRKQMLNKHQVIDHTYTAEQIKHLPY